MNADERNFEIEHLRWLIDQKLEYFKSFESRALQLLGISGLLLTLIWTGYSFETAQRVEIALITIFLIIVAIKCVVFLSIGRPKKSETALTPGDQDHIYSNLNDYFKTISTHLATRAKKTNAIYLLFAAQIFLLVALTVVIILRP